MDQPGSLQIDSLSDEATTAYTARKSKLSCQQNGQLYLGPAARVDAVTGISRSRVQPQPHPLPPVSIWKQGRIVETKSINYFDTLRLFRTRSGQGIPKEYIFSLALPFYVVHGLEKISPVK